MSGSPRRAALGWIAAAVLAAAGCAGPAAGAERISLNSFNRTFDTIVAAMASQHLAVSRQDRREGVVVGTEAGVTITATLRQQYDGSYQVSFRQGGDATGPSPLLAAVVKAYDERMAQFKVLKNFSGEP